MNDQKATQHRNDGSLTTGDQLKAPISPSPGQRRWLSIFLLSLAICGLVIVLLVSLDFPRFGLAVLTWLPAISWLGVVLGFAGVLILQRRQEHQAAHHMQAHSEVTAPMQQNVTRLLALVEELHRDPSRYEDPLHHKREEAEQ